MIKEKYRNYINWGITVFLIILCSIFVFFVMLRWGDVRSGFHKLVGIVEPILIGVIIAYLVDPMRATFVRWMNRIPGKQGVARGKLTRCVAIALALAVLVAIVAFVIGTLLPQVIDTLRMLVQNVDHYSTALEEWVSPLLENNPQIRTTVTGAIEELETKVQMFFRNDIMSLISTLTSGVMSVGKFVYNAVLGLIVSVYLLSSKDRLIGRMKKIVISVLKGRQANTVLDISRQTNRMFQGFIMGKILDSSIIGVLCFIGMTVLKIPYALLISVVVGITNVIPYFGPFIGAVPSALLILIEDPAKCLVFVIFIFVLQQIDGNLIGPKVLGNTTGLSSLGVLFSILIGGGLFGIVGMIVSVPACGVIYTVLKRAVDSRLRKKRLPSDTKSYMNVRMVDEEHSLLK